MTGNDFPDVPGAQTGKRAPLVFYGPLGFLMTRGRRAMSRLSGAIRVATGRRLAATSGITNQLHQLFTPRRSRAWRDVVADAADDNGDLFGTAFFATRILERAPNHP